MKSFCFTVDDNILFLRDLSTKNYNSIFDHPYLAVYHNLRKKYGVKVQLNLFYETEGFNLSMMTDRYKREWEENSNWLKLSFHSRGEKARPYEFSCYEEVFLDCKKTHEEIIRFAGEKSLAKTTTIHYCLLTKNGVCAVKDNGVLGLLGLYGTEENKRNSYQTSASENLSIRKGKIVKSDGVIYSGIDIVLNNYSAEEIISILEELKGRKFIKVMIHEQYFYRDYKHYQEDFGEKLDRAFDFLKSNGYDSIFFEECEKELE